MIEAVREAVLDGFALGATGPREVELGERIRSAMPSMQRMRFVSSGTEAVMSAIRLARGATGRDLLVKFENRLAADVRPEQILPQLGGKGQYHTVAGQERRGVCDTPRRDATPSPRGVESGGVAAGHLFARVVGLTVL